MSQDLMLDFISPCEEFKLSFDDDGKVAYAYLNKNGKIVGEVWLYNRRATPTEPEWNDKKNIPFANPLNYTVPQSEMLPAKTVNDVVVTWEGKGEDIVAYIYIFNDLIGVLGFGDKPGYAKYAKSDGPLARVFDVE